MSVCGSVLLARHGRSSLFVSAKMDDFVKKCGTIDDLTDSLRKQQKTIAELNHDIEFMRKQRDDITDTVVDLQCRSMKDNLIFTGLGGESNTEETELKLRDFLHHELGLDSERIEFGNVHRYGQFKPGRQRPIVARFLHHRDLITVNENSYKLAGSPFGINEQFPAVIEDRRRQLYPIMKRLKRNRSNKVKLVRDRLYVNGELYDERFDHERMDAQASSAQSKPASPKAAQRDREPAHPKTK
jgi:hypothetical protein